MNDKKKLELIDQMIGNYYEFCSFDDQDMNAGSLQMLIGCIEAVLMQDCKGEDDDDEGCCCCDASNDCSENTLSPDAVRAIKEFADAVDLYADMLLGLDEDE